MQTAAQDSFVTFLGNLNNILLNGQEEMQFKKANSVEETLLGGEETGLRAMCSSTMAASFSIAQVQAKL